MPKRVVQTTYRVEGDRGEVALLEDATAAERLSRAGLTVTAHAEGVVDG